MMKKAPKRGFVWLNMMSYLRGFTYAICLIYMDLRYGIRHLHFWYLKSSEPANFCVRMLKRAE